MCRYCHRLHQWHLPPCRDRISDCTTRPWYKHKAFFVLMIASVWHAGTALAFKHREFSWRPFATAALFPFQMIIHIYGLLSLATTWSCSEASLNLPTLAALLQHQNQRARDNVWVVGWACDASMLEELHGDNSLKTWRIKKLSWKPQFTWLSTYCSS